MTRTTTSSPCVLWYVPVGEIGGVARHVLDVARNGIPGHRLVVACPDGPLAQQLRETGTDVRTAAISTADGARTAVPALRRVIREVRPTILHSHLAFADFVAAAARTGIRGAGAPVRHVSTEHGISGIRGLYQTGRAQALVKSTLHRARLLRTERVIAVSESTRDQVIAQWGGARRITVIRNGVDAPQPAPEIRAGMRVLSLSRLAPEKNIDHLLRAFVLVRDQEPEATLTVAGTGPEEARLRDVAAELGLESSVTFPGHVESDPALRNHDVVAQLSTWENLSYTLLDAVEYGLGVVATDVGGNREIVPGNCLVDATDHRQVARAILSQGRDVDARPRATRDGDKTAPWSIADMCDAIAQVYSEVKA